MKPLGVIRNPNNNYKKYFMPPFKSAGIMQQIKINVRDYMIRASWMGNFQVATDCQSVGESPTKPHVELVQSAVGKFDKKLRSSKHGVWEDGGNN